MFIIRLSQKLLILTSYFSLASCQTQFECDVNSDSCPGLIIEVTSSSVIKKSNPEKLEFSIASKPEGKPEDPKNVKAAIVSVADDVPCRQALTSDPKPNIASLALPSVTPMPDGKLLYVISPSQTELNNLSIGKAKLCVYGRDIGGANLAIINKIVKISNPPATQNAFQGVTGYINLEPVGVSIAKSKEIFFLFNANPGGDKNTPVRDVRVAKYNRANNSLSFTSDSLRLPGMATNYSPALASPDSTKFLVLRPDKKPTDGPSRFELYTCDLGTLANCNTDNSFGAQWNIAGSVLALAADRESDAFVIMTSGTADGLRYYSAIDNLDKTASLSTKQQWVADKAANTSERVILALGDLASDESGKNFDGRKDIVAVQNTSPLDVRVIVQPKISTAALSKNSTYSDGLMAAIQNPAALGSAKPDALVLGDLDGDGLADIVLGSDKAFRVLFNSGDGSFRVAGAAPLQSEEKSLVFSTSASIKEIAIGDVDDRPGNEIVVLTAPAANTAAISVYSLM